MMLLGATRESRMALFFASQQPYGRSAGDKHRARAVVDDVVGHAAEQEPSRPIESAGADDDQIGAFGVSRGDDALARLPGPHQEIGIDAFVARSLNDGHELLLAVCAQLIK